MHNRVHYAIQELVRTVLQHLAERLEVVVVLLELGDDRAEVASTATAQYVVFLAVLKGPLEGLHAKQTVILHESDDHCISVARVRVQRDSHGGLRTLLDVIHTRRVGDELGDLLEDHA